MNAALATPHALRIPAATADDQVVLLQMSRLHGERIKEKIMPVELGLRRERLHPRGPRPETLQIRRKALRHRHCRVQLSLRHGLMNGFRHSLRSTILG